MNATAPTSAPVATPGRAVSTAPPRPPISTGGAVAALIPKTVEEMFRVAQAISASGMAPTAFNSVEKVLVAVMAGAELGFPPFQSVQSFAVINNRPAIWGDAIPALLWSRGFDIDEWFDNEAEPTIAYCKITRPGGKEVERTYSLADAKLANLLGKTGPWQTNRKRMIQMRARAFAARDGAADVLRGFQVREEVEDYGQPARNVTPQGTGMLAKLEGRQAASTGFDADHIARETAFDPATGEITEGAQPQDEIIDAEIEEETATDGPGAAQDGDGPQDDDVLAQDLASAPDEALKPWCEGLKARADAAEEASTLFDLWSTHFRLGRLGVVHDRAPDLYADLESFFAGRRAKIGEAA